jgi:hypothetical protein
MSEPAMEYTALDFAEAGLSVDDWLAYMDRFGHVCCCCPRQNPPVPCHNSGHADAVSKRREFEQIVGGSDV